MQHQGSFFWKFEIDDEMSVLIVMIFSKPPCVNLLTNIKIKLLTIEINDKMSNASNKA